MISAHAATEQLSSCIARIVRMPLILLLPLPALLDRLQLVADAVARLDERVPRRHPVDLVAQPPDEDVDGPVPMGLAPAPDLLQQLVASGHTSAIERERVEEPKLGPRELGAPTVDVRLHLAWIDPQLLDLDRLAALLRLCPDTAPRGCLYPGDELLHRERFHEVVVGPDLQRVDAVVLGAAGADDDDRRADPLCARGLDEAPAVEPGEHQIEHHDVWRLVAQSRQANLASADGDRVEAGPRQVLRHRRGDHVIVLHDQNLGHSTYLIEGE